MIYTDPFILRLLFLRCLCRVAPKSFILSWMVASICWFKLVQLLGATMYTSKLTSSKLRFVNLRASFYWVIHWTLFFNLFYMSMWYSVTVPKLRFADCCTNKRIWMNEWIWVQKVGLLTGSGRQLWLQRQRPRSVSTLRSYWRKQVPYTWLNLLILWSSTNENRALLW